MRIKALPKEYKGVWFRSHLEADHAKWFDSLGIEWAYETEGFDLGGIWYLPDFWLPRTRAFFEVKGVFESEDIDKVLALARVAAPRGIQVGLGTAPDGCRASLRKLRPT
jgi:hypothetical protein